MTLFTVEKLTFNLFFLPSSSIHPFHIQLLKQSGLVLWKQSPYITLFLMGICFVHWQERLLSIFCTSHKEIAMAEGDQDRREQRIHSAFSGNTP